MRALQVYAVVGTFWLVSLLGLIGVAFFGWGLVWLLAKVIFG